MLTSKTDNSDDVAQLLCSQMALCVQALILLWTQPLAGMYTEFGVPF